MSEPMQTDIDEGLYSRQLYVLGHDAMRRMQVGFLALPARRVLFGFHSCPRIPKRAFAPHYKCVDARCA